MIQDSVTILSHPLVVGLSVLAVSLYLGYLFALRREKKLEVTVRHSGELKDLVKRWKTELPLIPDPICPAISEISELELPVENELLFAHLGEHMPRDLDILETWNGYKRLLLEYNERRFHLTEEISSEMYNRTGFQYRPVAEHGMGKKGFTKHLLALAYNQLARLDDEKVTQEYSNKRLLIKDLGGRFDLRDFSGNTVLAWISSQETHGSSEYSRPANGFLSVSI